MVQCTIYAQISVPWGKDDVICMTPQWGSNSKVSGLLANEKVATFQSPQWGSNSKELGSSCRKDP